MMMMKSASESPLISNHSATQAGTIWAQGNAFFVVAPTPFMRADPIVVTQVQTYLDENFVKVRQKKATGYMGGEREDRAIA
jgi:hypothetical protein